MITPVGNSARFQEVLKGVHAVAPAQCTVLIQGETGTGKEVIARCDNGADVREVIHTARNIAWPMKKLGQE